MSHIKPVGVRWKLSNTIAFPIIDCKEMWELFWFQLSLIVTGEAGEAEGEKWE
jgi:hypothetical protein